MYTTSDLRGRIVALLNRTVPKQDGWVRFTPSEISQLLPGSTPGAVSEQLIELISRGVVEFRLDGSIHADLVRPIYRVRRGATAAHAMQPAARSFPTERLVTAGLASRELSHLLRMVKR